MTKDEELSLLAEKTVKAFDEYLTSLAKFKIAAGLGSVNNVHEVCNAMTDKHGRICRLIKHAERNDPKTGWRIELCKNLSGYLAYSEMIIEKYNLINTMHTGMKVEMMDSVSQHAS